VSVVNLTGVTQYV